MVDALATYEPKGSGLFLKINSGEPATLRVLTLDPLVSIDQWGGTKYAFVVWNWNEGKAQIWQTTPGNLKKLTAIHRDEDLEPLNKTDIKVSATGEALEKRYDIIPLPKAKELTNDMIKQAQNIVLEEKINDNKGRLSEYSDEGEDVSGYEKARATADSLRNKDQEDVVVEDIGDGDVNLDDIPL